MADLGLPWMENREEIGDWESARGLTVRDARASGTARSVGAPKTGRNFSLTQPCQEAPLTFYFSTVSHLPFAFSTQ